ncbi:hypothetical protein [Alkalibacter mobilis]|uniref:hypothetical protein n=1 Tax=Alkalibacter mobilis TaxID=2787712 RepID=UPI00189CBB3D|nr:hypothetical protein [Alkalibacter mobilis]MBF7097681.1 hypothetical protein [Alkalibacter mobilis]
MSEISSFSIEDLKDELMGLEEDLEEVQMEKTMVLGQTGMHISSKKVMQQAKEFEEEISSIKKQIQSIKKELKRRSH